MGSPTLSRYQVYISASTLSTASAKHLQHDNDDIDNAVLFLACAANGLGGLDSHKHFLGLSQPHRMGPWERGLSLGFDEYITAELFRN